MTIIEASHWHVGRGWSDIRIEDECPCVQEPCGLVSLGNASPECDQHTVMKTMRQGHSAQNCPGS